MTPLRFSLLMMITAVLPIAGCSFVGGVFGAESMYDEPEYTVTESIGEQMEIRSYKPRLAAQATLTDVDEMPERRKRNAAFQLLFDYISGENQVKQKIAMTVPVSMEQEKPKSEKIAMTAPVQVEDGNEGPYRMQFFLPKEYTYETAPEPLNEQVEIIQMPAQVFAVNRLKGSTNEERLNKAEEALNESLRAAGWLPLGDAVVYYYDPPFTIPALRRTEVVIPVEAPAAEAPTGMGSEKQKEAEQNIETDGKLDSSS